jgi:hypothetical protein
MAFKRASKEDRPQPVAGSEGDYFDLARFKDQIMGFEVLLFDAEYENRFDETKPAVKANVTIVTGPSRGSVYEGEWIEHQVIVATLKNFVGDTYVGRVVKGKKAYFINELEDAEYDDAEAVILGVEAQPTETDVAAAIASAPDSEPPF